MIKQLYSVRYYPEGKRFSEIVGHKYRLVSFRLAVKLVRRLKKSGIDAFYTKF
jgi:hypothetical protein